MTIMAIIIIIIVTIGMRWEPLRMAVTAFKGGYGHDRLIFIAIIIHCHNVSERGWLIVILMNSVHITAAEFYERLLRLIVVPSSSLSPSRVTQTLFIHSSLIRKHLR